MLLYFYFQFQGKRATPLPTGAAREAPAAAGRRYGRVPPADGGGAAFENGRGGGGVRLEFSAVLLDGPRVCGQLISPVFKIWDMALGLILVTYILNFDGKLIKMMTVTQDM